MHGLVFGIGFLISGVVTYFSLDMYTKTSPARLTESPSQVEVIPTAVEELLPTQAFSPTPTIKIRPVSPVPTVVKSYHYTSEQIHGFIDRFAVQYGVDPNVLRAIAICESGFRAEAINGKYAGLFQFSQNSWSVNRSLMGEDPDPQLRFSAEEAVQTAAYLISKGKSGMWPNCAP